jgi:hypothetical protein
MRDALGHLQEDMLMVFGTGIDELVIVGVALSLPIWLALEEVIHRSGPHVARRPAEASAPQGSVTAVAA